MQNREKIHPGTYLGSGKIGELREMVWEMGATGVICDDELSPAQLRNLESALDTKVMDRTMVILDIFAAHATTSEGKIQVELAQLRYRAARLVGLRSSLSRLGGGIGTRGPGEKKLEMDRRLIHERIGQLKSELEDVKRHREVTRKQRDRKYTLSAAIVGYTNAGKSTLLNTLTASFTNVNAACIIPGALLLAAIAWWLRKDLAILDVISLGREQAVSLGVDYERTLRRLMVGVALYIAVATALVGPLSFLGLITANVARQLFTTYRHTWLIAGSACVGMLILTAGQFVVEHVMVYAVPVSVFVTIGGGIYFLYLVLTAGKR